MTFYINSLTSKSLSNLHPIVIVTSLTIFGFATIYLLFSYYYTQTFLDVASSFLHHHHPPHTSLLAFSFYRLPSGSVSQLKGESAMRISVVASTG